MKKSIIPQIIYTFILLTIAINVGVFLFTIFEKNKKIIKKNEFPEYNEIAAFFDQHVQDPEYFYFYLTSNQPAIVQVTYYDTDLNLKASKNYTVDGYLKVVENLSALFNATASQLDNTQVQVLIKTKDTPNLYEDSVLLREADKVLIVNVNVPSYLKLDTIYDLIPPEKIIYLFNNVNSLEWYDPYAYATATLPNAKIIRVYINENFNTYTDTITFKDSNTGDPIVNARVYVNSYFVGYTDSNGEIKIKYHRNYDGYLKLVDKCYYYSELHTFQSNSETIYVDSNC